MVTPSAAAEQPSGVAEKINAFLYRPVDIAPLAVFRVLMGILAAAEGWGAIMTGWVRANYVDVSYNFNFIGFEFLHVLIGPQAYAIYFLLGAAGLGIAFGYRYRLSVAVYTVLWAAVYFGQKTSYNNHYYLLLLMCILLLIVPAHRAVSLDVRNGRVAPAQAVPYWSKWIFKILLLIVYTYAAIAKLYPDWLSGKAVEIFLSSRTHYPIIGPLCGERWFIMLISYGGIVFDFLVVPALWWRPTRGFAFVVSIGFHIFNSVVFHIGIFPYMMLICTVLYFDQAVIRKLFFRRAPLWAGTPAGLLLPSRSGAEIDKTKKVFLEVFLFGFIALMVLLPLRPFIYPGSPHWSEEGHRLSWHMMLRSKSGTVYYVIKDSEGVPLKAVHPAKELPHKQARSMATRPDKIWQYAQKLGDEYSELTSDTVQVYARSKVSLNGRPFYPMIDPEADLYAAEWSHIRPSPWILPHPEL